MVAECLKLNIPIKDKDFDGIYPAYVRTMSKHHFTPIEIAIKAAEFLVTKPKQKILDIGCGVGKFCFVAGAYTEANYTGVDYREHFIDLCRKLTAKHRFKNVDFIHDNIINIDFTLYSAFYFFNPFEEHADSKMRLDDTVEVSPASFKLYSDYVREQFERLPAGTRIVTYYADMDQIPSSYRLISMHFDGLLKCWEKSKNKQNPG